MPVFQTFVSFIGCIPTNIWQALKKFVAEDKISVYDTPFKLSTKYTPALLVVMLCLSLANQFVRNIEMDCATSSDTQRGHSAQELNNYCWNMDTFLVAKGLEPEMRGRVTYPGVFGYNKETDQIIKQGYYKFIWLVVATLTVVSYAPYFIWKIRGTRKIQPIVEAYENDQVVAHFIATIGFNNTFAIQYFVCKVVATLTPFCSWIYLSGFIGQRYRWYGLDVISYHLSLSEANSWPNPQDALFPKMAKCEWSKFGYSGDRETMAIQCQLPMNNITQWSFFFFWWWMAINFMINVFSCILFLIMAIPCYRQYRYRKLVTVICQTDVELARNSSSALAKFPYNRNFEVQQPQRTIKTTDIVSSKLGFGDWLVLNFMKKNLDDWEFRDFIRKLATTKNPVLQINPEPKINNKIKSKKGKAGNKFWTFAPLLPSTHPNGGASMYQFDNVMGNGGLGSDKLDGVAIDGNGSMESDPKKLEYTEMSDYPIITEVQTPPRQPSAPPQMGFVTPQRGMGFVDPNPESPDRVSGTPSSSSSTAQLMISSPAPIIRSTSNTPKSKNNTNSTAAAAANTNTTRTNLQKLFPPPSRRGRDDDYD